MIEIINKQDCCGCSACEQSCPKQCISMQADDEGFVYPLVKKSQCIDCGICNKVCPTINSRNSQKPISVYASKHRNEEIRLRSSSGGIFTAIAEDILNKGGVVFGAKFDDEWNVIHSHTETLDGLAAFRGSKYIQSLLGNSFQHVKSFLQQGRQVLFSGTPCQIAGLKKYLKKEYVNLFTIEILCHGVPSPKVWREYLNEKKNIFKCNNITNIEFRNKKTGWSKFKFIIQFENNTEYEVLATEDLFFKGFLHNLYLRPSCYCCRSKNGRAGSDITIADYWNINEALPAFNDEKGVSLILVNSERAQKLLQSLSSEIEAIETSYEVCTGKNGGFVEKLPVHRHRQSFFKEMRKRRNSITEIIDDNLRYKLTDRLLAKAKKIFK